MRAAYPNLRHLWSIGPAAAPYNVMHLLMQNVAPLLWRLLAGEAPGGRLPKTMSSLPSLRNIDLKYRSINAINWMYWLVSTAEVRLAGQFTDLYYELLLALCKVCRVLFRPRGISSPALLA